MGSDPNGTSLRGGFMEQAGPGLETRASEQGIGFGVSNDAQSFKIRPPILSLKSPSAESSRRPPFQYGIG